RGFISAHPQFISYSGQASHKTTSASLSSLERKADQIIRDGLSVRGTPYRFGASVGSGYYDCSLFVQQVYRHNGIDLPRNSRQQYNAVDKISKSNLRKGDLVFFDIVKRDGIID